MTTRTICRWMIGATAAAIAGFGTPLGAVQRGAVAPKAPTALTVASASRSAVSLAWTGSDVQPARFIVERKGLGAAWPAAVAPRAGVPRDPKAPLTPSTIAAVETTSATDKAIDAFATYVYRVRAVGPGDAMSAPSNEVVAGPPPVGFNSVLAAPKAMHEHDPAQFANQIRMTFDANGDPALAYVTSDLNNDGDMSDSELAFISWNRARYRWNAPVHVDTVGDVVRSGSRVPFAIARDDSTGRFGILTMIADREIRWLYSDDGGLAWKGTAVQRTGPEEGTLSTPSLAMAAGRVHLAYYLGNVGIRYHTGLATDSPDKWPATLAPGLPNTSEPLRESVTVVLDAAGKPGVAYWLGPSSGYNMTLAFWRPGTATAVKVADTVNHQADDPALHMAIAGSQIAIVLFAGRDEKFFDNHHLWFVQSKDNGATWSTPVVVADDGGNAMGPPITVSLDRSGRVAMAAELAGGNSGEVKCGSPKLMRSTDGMKWTTCAPDTKGAPETSDVTYPVVAFAGNDKLYVAFKTRASAPGLAAGLNLWRER